MYRAILNEIGADESNMGYLFDESSDEDIGVEEHERDESNALGHGSREVAMNYLNDQNLVDSDDDHLLHRWDSDAEDSATDDPNKIERDVDVVQPFNTQLALIEAPTQTGASNNTSTQEPTWKQMIEVVNAKQEQLMGEMNYLSNMQKQSSPRNKIRNNMIDSEQLQLMHPLMQQPMNQLKHGKEDEDPAQEQLVLKEINDNDHKFFSPASSTTKIPSWRSSASKTNSTGMSQEMEESKTLISQLEAQLEESRAIQKSQNDELIDYKNRLKKCDIEHQEFLLKYETEKISWKDEIKEKEAFFHQEITSRDANLKETRQKLQNQINLNQDLIEKYKEEFKQMGQDNAMLKKELEAKSNHKESAYIQELKDENLRLKTDFTRKEELEKTQQEIKSQMKVAIEEQTKKTRQFQSRIRELEGRHAEELEYWKSEVDGYRRQIESITTQYAELEQKHDKEVKEWQLLLDADITKDVADKSDTRYGKNENNALVIGAGNTSTGSLSPIRNARSSTRQNNDNDSGSIPSQSMNMIDDLLQEIGEIGLEGNNILKEIGNGDDSYYNESVHNVNKSKDSFASTNNPTELSMVGIGYSGSEAKKKLERTFGSVSIEEYPHPIESLDNSLDQAKGKDMDESNHSEVLDETLHLLHNLKSMINSNENEHETTVIEQLEVLSQLMQSQDQPSIVLASGTPNVSEIRSGYEMTSDLVRDGASFVSALQETHDEASRDPWPALVSELRDRCAFLERDRDEVTRITEQILEMERASHKMELATAIATAERKANEKLRQIQLESNRDMSLFYRNICFQCHDEAFDYSNHQEEKGE